MAWKEYRGGAFGHLSRSGGDIDASVLLLGHFEVTGTATGMDFKQEVGQLLGFRDGKIVSSRDFLSHAEALEATGLRE